MNEPIHDLWKTFTIVRHVYQYHLFTTKDTKSTK